ncbi:hypothetical protein B7494_g1712 [Chlorociboria aeruginascens]|nr:hypothetical protein B7494_g1712 [Chlorociboria aeruginascens]
MARSHESETIRRKAPPFPPRHQTTNEQETSVGSMAVAVNKFVNLHSLEGLPIEVLEPIFETMFNVMVFDHHFEIILRATRCNAKLYEAALQVYYNHIRIHSSIRTRFELHMTPQALMRLRHMYVAQMTQASPSVLTDSILLGARQITSLHINPRGLKDISAFFVLLEKMQYPNLREFSFELSRYLSFTQTNDTLASLIETANRSFGVVGVFDTVASVSTGILSRRGNLSMICGVIWTWFHRSGPGVELCERGKGYPLVWKQDQHNEENKGEKRKAKKSLGRAKKLKV